VAFETRVAGSADCRAPCGRGAARLRLLATATVDAMVALLIVVAGIVALSPFSGLAAAREVVAGRREERRHLGAEVAAQSAVWRRQARRNAAARRASLAVPGTPPRFDF
jgi:hypothetical protein